MAANDVPFLYFLDPGFLAFLAVCAVCYGIWSIISWMRGR